MTWLIVGSVAQYHWFPDARIPVDIDLLTPAKVVGNESKVCVVDSQWHDVADAIIAKNKDPVFLDANLLYTLKVSHAEWDVKWKKTMYDINFLKLKGCQLDLDLLKKLKPVWEQIHGKKHVKMSQPMETFFSDHVKRVYDHEYLHTLVKFNDASIHEMLRPDTSTAWCSEELFNKLALFHKYECALEEMMATAIERSKLTSASKNSELSIAMAKAHFQLVTSMTTGWFCRFLILNRAELLFERKEKWITQMKTALNTLANNSQCLQ